MNAPSSASASVAPPRWLAAGVLALGAAAFAGTLTGGFLGDDFVYVARFLELPWAAWPGFFTQEWSGGLWGFPLKELRPFAALSFMADARLWGDSAIGWRLTNLVLLLGSAWCVMRLAGRYSAQPARAALIAGLIFVLHPVQTEPVAWITGRVDLLAALAALAYWCAAENYCDTRRGSWLAVALAALFGGIFSKEFCLLAPGLLLLAWLLIPSPTQPSWKPRLILLAGSLGMIALYAWCRHQAFGGGATQGNTSPQDPAVWQRQASYLGWLLPWLPGVPRHEFAAPPAGALIRTAWLAAVAAVLAGSVWLRWRRRTTAATILFFGGAWWLVTTAGLLFVGYFSPRHLHFTTVGLALAAGVALAAIPRRGWRTVVVTALFGWLVTVQWRAVRPWREAGRLSAGVLTAAQAELGRAPAGALLAVAVPSTWQTAWLWSWSAPHFAAPPFLHPGLPPERVLFGEGNYYRGDWLARVAPGYAAAVARAPAVVALWIGPDARMHCRTVVGAELALGAATLASLSENGLTDAEWTTWVQQLSPQ